MTQAGSKFALVTGASSGLGWEFAQNLAKRGYSLIVVARREERLLKLKSEIEKAHDVTVHMVALDLAAPQAAQTLFAKTKALGVTVSVLVNNAGFGIKGAFLENDLLRVEEMIRLNVSTLTSLTHVFAHDMKAKGKGFILQVASIGAFQPCPYFAVYAATKSYVLSFGEALSYELAPHDVQVTTLCPGATATEFFSVSNFKPPVGTDRVAMSAAEVAEAGLDALFKKRVSLTTGWMNRANSALVKIMPRTLVRRVVGRMMK